MHEEPAPGVTDRLKTRLSPSHRPKLIDVVERSPSDYPEVRHLPPEKQGLALREYRPATQQWLFAEAK